jgi:hypothetical protein
VNSSATQYRDTVLAVAAARDRMATEPENDGLVAALEKQVREIDTPAYDRGEYWSLVIEQIWDTQF